MSANVQDLFTFQWIKSIVRRSYIIFRNFANERNPERYSKRAKADRRSIGMWDFALMFSGLAPSNAVMHLRCLIITLK